jgi:hypothetical protein
MIITVTPGIAQAITMPTRTRRGAFPVAATGSFCACAPAAR